MNKEFIIKKNIFGGFDRRQVIDYLAQLQSKCGDSATHEEIESTKEKIKVLIEKIEEKDRKIKNLNDELKELNSLKLQSEQIDGFESLSEADKIINNAKTEAQKYIHETKQTVISHNEQFEKIMTKISSLNKEIELIGTNAGKISSEIENITVAEDEYVNIEPEITENIPETSDNNIEEYESEEIIDFILPETTEVETEISDAFNYIDNFFSELEKITGSADYYEGQDITTCYDRPNKTQSDTKSDEAFDEHLKNIIKGTPQT
ncbi:MAG: hypothetical protein U0K91_04105 [Acutalibacteraceae bacterium]|nr:hypothetical protein [Acutalibacteraceae bacterium]